MILQSPDTVIVILSSKFCFGIVIFVNSGDPPV